MEAHSLNMDHWQQHAHGRYLLQVEREALAALLPQYFGYHLLQIGGPAVEPYIESSLINHAIRAVPSIEPGFSGSTVCCDFEEMPFMSQSLDVVVMPHILENTQAPAQMVSAVYEALIGEGHCIVIGFNPMSYWRVAKWWRQKDAVLQDFKALSAFKVRRYLTDAGFDILQHKNLAFRPPYLSDSRFDQNLFLEPFGSMCCRFIGCLYVIVARKRMLTPVLNGFVEKKTIPLATPELS